MTTTTDESRAAIAWEWNTIAQSQAEYARQHGHLPGREAPRLGAEGPGRGGLQGTIEYFAWLVGGG